MREAGAPPADQPRGRQLVALHDLYCLTVIAVVLLASRAPSPGLKAAIVRGLGWASYRWSRSKRGTVRHAVARALAAGLSPARREGIVQASFRGFWLEMLSWLPAPTDEAAFRAARIRGLEHLERAAAAGRGAILWESSGFGGRAVAKQFLHRHGWSVYQLHGPRNLGGFLTDESARTWVSRYVVRSFFAACERRFVARAIDIPESPSAAFGRTLAGLLARNRVLCVTSDGEMGRHRIPAAFLGHQVAFSSGMLTLSQVSGAPLLPLFCARGAAGITVAIGPPLPFDTTLDRRARAERALSAYLEAFESHVRAHPDQYRNCHLLGAWEARSAPGLRARQAQSSFSHSEAGEG